MMVMVGLFVHCEINCKNSELPQLHVNANILNFDGDEEILYRLRLLVGCVGNLLIVSFKKRLIPTTYNWC